MAGLNEPNPLVLVLTVSPPRNVSINRKQTNKPTNNSLRFLLGGRCPSSQGLAPGSSETSLLGSPAKHCREAGATSDGNAARWKQPREQGGPARAPSQQGLPGQAVVQQQQICNLRTAVRHSSRLPKYRSVRNQLTNVSKSSRGDQES